MYKMLSTASRDFIIIHRICILCNVFLKNMQFPLAYSKKLLYIYEVSHDNVNLKNHFYRILKEDFEMKEKVVLAYSGGLDTTAIISITMLYAAASTVARAVSWMAYRREQNSPAHPNYTLKIW